MNIRFLIVLVAPLHIVTAATAADTSSPMLSPGRYVSAGNSGTLVIRRGSPGEFKFEIESIGGNCHSCSVSGTIRGKLGRADSWEADGSDSKCRITFDRDGDGVKVEPSTPQACRAYCGMRAGFDGIYKTVPANCTRKSQQTSRDKFLKFYRSRDYKKASDVLVNLVSQCAEFMNWIVIDSVRNDLALAQFRAGDSSECIKTLTTTRAAEYSNDEQLKDAFPPCDFDNYINVAKATWHNRSLCERSGGAKQTSDSVVGHPSSK
jgi:hypothetical protein